MIDDITNILRNNKFGIYKKLNRLGLIDCVLSSTSFLDGHYQNISWSQRFWHILNNQHKVVKCVCGHLAKYSTSRHKYVACSVSCRVKKNSIICLERYGVDNYSKTREYHVKFKNTCLKKFGTDHSSKSENFGKKYKATCLERYGFENYTQTDKFKFTSKEAIKQYITKMQQNIGCEYKIKDLNNGTYTIYHSACNKKFNIHSFLLSQRRLKRHEICTHCNPTRKSYSFREKEVVDFIKSIYNGEVIENSRKVIPPKELDVYLPDLKLAIEYNGTYSHADPRKYKAGDMIFYKTAQSIWDTDRLKIYLCDAKGIKLIQIKEIDWVNKRKILKYKLKKLIADAI